MARLRVRFKFNPGRHGAPLDKLGEFSIQVEKFLRSLSGDIGLKALKGEWLARNFQDSSVGFDTEYAAAVADEIAAKNVIAIGTLIGGSPMDAPNKGLVTYGTMSEFSRIGKTMSPDEHFDIGLYSDDAAAEPEWNQIAYGQLSQIRQLLDTRYIAYGSAQGVMHGWTMEGDDPSFTLRELSSGALVKCLYDKTLHAKLHDATENPNSVLLVYGDMEWDRATNSIVEVTVSDLQTTRTLTESEFEGLFGAAPNYVGSMTSTEYIEWLRGDGE